MCHIYVSVTRAGSTVPKDQELLIDVSVGKKIRDRRQDKKISQNKLARLLGISPAAVCQWETKGIVPRAKTLAKVAQALGVSEDYLIGGRPAPAIGGRRAPAAETATGESVSELIEKIKAKISAATGVPVAQIDVNVTIVSGNGHQAGGGRRASKSNLALFRETNLADGRKTS